MGADLASERTEASSAGPAHVLNSVGPLGTAALPAPTESGQAAGVEQTQASAQRVEAICPGPGERSGPGGRVSQNQPVTRNAIYFSLAIDTP